MNMSAELELFDLASKNGNQPWSPYSWKVRLCLNYKRIPYHTTFLEYPAVAPTLQSLGIAPGDPSLGHGAAYTIPSVRLPDGSGVMESMAIARRLESYPAYADNTHLLHLDNPIVAEAEAAVLDFNETFYPNFMAGISAVLNGPSREYFDRTRTAIHGMDMHELRRTKGGEGPWRDSQPAIRKMAEMLGRNAGPFLLGQHACYGDFVMVAFWQFLRRVEADAFRRLMAFDDVFPRLYGACEHWIRQEVDGEIYPH